jgi:hypothetical protein
VLSRPYAVLAATFRAAGIAGPGPVVTDQKLSETYGWPDAGS